MRIGWRPKAKTDLREITAYIEDRNPTAARRVVRAIREQIRLLDNRPNLGQPGRAAGARELVIASTPDIVAYMVDGATPAGYIHRVLHGARRWPAEFNGSA